MIERVRSCRSQDARLPQPAADALAQPADDLHAIVRGRDHRARRRAQALAQADADRVGLLAEARERNPGRDVRVPEARSVEVKRQPGGVRCVGHRFQLFERPDRSAAAVVRVLDGDGLLARVVIPLARAQCGLERLWREDPARAVDGQALHAPQRRDGAALVVHDVAIAIADDFVALAGQRAQRDLVRHRPGRHPDRRLLAEQLGDALLQRIDGRVFAVDVVAHLSGGHRLAHARGGLRDGVASQVDEVHWRCA